MKGGGRELGGWVVVERSTLFLSWTLEEVEIGGLRYDSARYVWTCTAVQHLAKTASFREVIMKQGAEHDS